VSDEFRLGPGSAAQHRHRDSHRHRLSFSLTGHILRAHKGVTRVEYGPQQNRLVRRGTDTVTTGDNTLAGERKSRRFADVRFHCDAPVVLRCPSERLLAAARGREHGDFIGVEPADARILSEAIEGELLLLLAEIHDDRKGDDK